MKNPTLNQQEIKVNYISVEVETYCECPLCKTIHTRKVVNYLPTFYFSEKTLKKLKVKK
jgi:hypothetical protein